MEYGSHIDILPTLMGILNLPIPTLVDGSDLLNENNDIDIQYLHQRLLAIRYKNYHYIYNIQTCTGVGLYDILNDPSEKTNLIKNKKKIVSHLNKYIKKTITDIYL